MDGSRRRRTVIVTGGSSGIGLAIVNYFASLEFHHIAILDINSSSSSSLLSQLSVQHPHTRFSFKKCDIASWDSQASAFAEIHAANGSIDVVVANAGVSEKGDFLRRCEVPTKPNLATLDINLSGTLFSVNLAVFYMRKNELEKGSRGSIVCTASNAGIYPFPMAPVYSASKHGVVGAVRSMARTLELDGIQINGLAPSVIATGLADDHLLGSMILTPVSTAVTAVREFIGDPKLTGVIAEVHGENVTFRQPPDFVDDDTQKNLEMFWKLGYA